MPVIVNPVRLFGAPGGQVVRGGIAASDDLTLTSTLSSTKDRIFLGSAQLSAYDELNTRLGINIAAPTERLQVGDLNTDAVERIDIQNSNTGTSAAAVFRARGNGAAQLAFNMNGLNRSSNIMGQARANAAECLVSGTSALMIGSFDNVPVIIGANNTARLNIQGDVTVQPAVATPAAGSTSARLLFGTTAAFGIYYGSGAPTVVAAKGSIYLRSDGAGTTSRIYVATDSAGTWTNVVTSA